MIKKFAAIQMLSKPPTNECSLTSPSFLNINGRQSVWLCHLAVVLSAIAANLFLSTIQGAGCCDPVKDFLELSVTEHHLSWGCQLSPPSRAVVPLQVILQRAKWQEHVRSGCTNCVVSKMQSSAVKPMNLHPLLCLPILCQLMFMVLSNWQSPI